LFQSSAHAPQVRHHVHVCYVPGDVEHECAAIRQHLSDRAFLTWSQSSTDPVQLALTKKNIDHSDYVLILVGEHYGSLSSSGASFLHLDFIYAMNQSKPMLVCNLVVPESKPIDYDRRKLLEFKQQVVRCGKPLINYGNAAELHAKILTSYSALLSRYPCAGWIRQPTEESKKPPLSDRTQEIRAISRSESSVPVEAMEDQYQVSLQDDVEIIYAVHAYQGGNLKDLRVKKRLVWGDILTWVGEETRMPVLEEAFAKIINDHLQQTSLVDVQRKLPEVHATAKVRVEAEDLSRLRNQFLFNDWLKHTHQATDEHKKFMLTPYGARQMAQWKSIKARQIV